MIGRTFIHYLGIVLGRELPQTQTTAAERDLLKQYLPGNKRIVEIGVFEGLTTRLLLEGADTDAIVFGVDPFLKGRLGISWGLQITKHYNRNYIRTEKLKLVRTLSTQVGKLIPDSVDYVFIDGDHSLAAITADWEFWSARVRPEGFIGLHDTVLTPDRDDEFGSHKYFESHIQHDPRFEVIDQVDSLSILRLR